MQKFVIFSNESEPGELSVVTAENAQAAKVKYCELVEVKKPDYLEYVYSEQIEFFQKDAKGHLFSISPKFGYAEISEGLIIREDLTPEDAMIIIARNIQQAFKDHPHYFDRYLEFYHGAGEVDFEEPELHIVSETWGLMPCPKDLHRRWGNYIKAMHERWQFPEEMLVLLAIATWTGDMQIIPLSQFEIN